MEGIGYRTAKLCSKEQLNCIDKGAARCSSSINQFVYAFVKDTHMKKRPTSFSFRKFPVLTVALVSCCVPLALASTNCVGPPQELISWWPAEGTTADIIGGNAGILLNGTTYAPGVVGTAFAFNGIDQLVLIPDAPAINPTNLTLEAWVLISLFSANDSVAIAGKDDPYSYRQYMLGMGNDTGPWTFRAHIGVPGGYRYFDGSTALQTSVWYHVAMTYDGASLKLYLNGNLDGSLAVSGPVVISPDPLLVGGHKIGPWNFHGLVDELSLYGRALSAAEIQGIYQAGDAGKCFTPFAPVIYAQPTNQTVFLGQDVTFRVGASGTPPLNYQWTFAGNDVPGATASTLTLTSAQTNEAGTYAVVVSNSVARVASSNALLTVKLPVSCTPAAAGLVSWWPGEGDATDIVSGNNGTVINSLVYAPGMVGEAFDHTLTNGAVIVPAASNLAVQSFTIECWINPIDMTTPRPILEYGNPGELSSLHLWYNIAPGIQGVPGALYGMVRDGTDPNDYVDLASAGGALAPNQWSHIAFTFDASGQSAQLFVNGVAVASKTFATPIHPKTAVAVNLGYRPVGSVDLWGGRRHLGRLDEVSVYDRALSTAEIQAIYAAASAGKCTTAVSPSISLQPNNQAVAVGDTVGFQVIASGTPPLSYQWLFNGSALPGATGNSLTLTNLQLSNAGGYSVIVSNAAGTVTSTTAQLTVNLLPAIVRVVGTDGPAGATVSVPIQLVANGNENAVGFSLNFPPSLLSYVGADLGSGASGASLLVNASQAANGTLGLALAFSAGTTFTAGTQEVVRVSFTTTVSASAGNAVLSFGDQPTKRELSDSSANVLPATFTSGVVDIAAASFEADVSPRPNGDKAVTVTDWVLVGRYAARLDYPTNSGEFERADCASRDTLGDGQITVADWVQAGRYATGLDPLRLAGGPTNEIPPGPNGLGLGKNDLAPRAIRVANANLIQNQIGSVAVYLDAQGNENALEFSLSFDTNVFTYTGGSLGADAAGATLIPNTSQASSGKLAFVLALSTGNSFAPGTKEVLKANLRPAGSASGTYPLALTDAPVPRQVVDAQASALSSRYVNGNVAINPLPTLNIVQTGQNVTLSWSQWANNFVLQQNGALSRSGSGWTNVTATIVTNATQNLVTVPLSGNAQFYRLQQH